MADKETLSSLSRRSFLKVAAAAGAAAAASAAGLAPAFAAPKAPKDKMSTPTITCYTSTQASITIEVCSGETGAPAGFSIQWMTKAAYDTNGWPDDDSSLCKASFSGNANTSRYDLAPNECVTVDIGDILFDNGASTNCDGALECGTDYVFRAFAHATSTLNRSDFTDNLTCSTEPCDTHGEGCTLMQGYWKTHNPLVCDTDPNSPLCIKWPVESLTLGTGTNNEYSPAQLVSILNAPVAGNGLISLAHQLIAAKLNIANGANPTDVASVIDEADGKIGDLVVPPVGTGYLAPSATRDLTTTLTNYNEGAIGPGHCS